MVMTDRPFVPVYVTAVARVCPLMCRHFARFFADLAFEESCLLIPLVGLGGGGGGVAPDASIQTSGDYCIVPANYMQVPATPGTTAS